jgi:hypothetical protein
MIRFYKMLSGEEIVAEVEDDREWSNGVELHKPCRHMMTNQGPIIARYPCDEVSVAMHHVLFSGEAVADLANDYRNVVGSVVVPSRKIEFPH